MGTPTSLGRRGNRESGFSSTELLVSVVILGIITAVVAAFWLAFSRSADGLGDATKTQTETVTALDRISESVRESEQIFYVSKNDIAVGIETGNSATKECVAYRYAVNPSTGTLWSDRRVVSTTGPCNNSSYTSYNHSQWKPLPSSLEETRQSASLKPVIEKIHTNSINNGIFKYFQSSGTEMTPGGGAGSSYVFPSNTTTLKQIALVRTSVEAYSGLNSAGQSSFINLETSASPKSFVDANGVPLIPPTCPVLTVQEWNDPALVATPPNKMVRVFSSGSGNVTVRVYVNGIHRPEATTSWVSEWSPGEYTVTAIAFDAATGLYSQGCTPRTIQIGTPPPTSLVVKNAPGPNANPSWSQVPADGPGFVATFDGQAGTNYRLTATRPANGQSYSFTVSGTPDGSGKITTNRLVIPNQFGIAWDKWNETINWTFRESGKNLILGTATTSTPPSPPQNLAVVRDNTVTGMTVDRRNRITWEMPSKTPTPSSGFKLFWYASNQAGFDSNSGFLIVNGNDRSFIHDIPDDGGGLTYTYNLVSLGMANPDFGVYPSTAATSVSVLQTPNDPAVMAYTPAYNAKGVAQVNIFAQMDSTTAANGDGSGSNILRWKATRGADSYQVYTLGYQDVLNVPRARWQPVGGPISAATCTLPGNTCQTTAAIPGGYSGRYTVVANNAAGPSDRQYRLDINNTDSIRDGVVETLGGYGFAKGTGTSNMAAGYFESGATPASPNIPGDFTTLFSSPPAPVTVYSDPAVTAPTRETNAVRIDTNRTNDVWGASWDPLVWAVRPGMAWCTDPGYAAVSNDCKLGTFRAAVNGSWMPVANVNNNDTQYLDVGYFFGNISALPAVGTPKTSTIGHGDTGAEVDTSNVGGVVQRWGGSYAYSSAAYNRNGKSPNSAALISNTYPGPYTVSISQPVGRERKALQMSARVPNNWNNPNKHHCGLSYNQNETFQTSVLKCSDELSLRAGTVNLRTNTIPKGEIDSVTASIGSVGNTPREYNGNNIHFDNKSMVRNAGDDRYEIEETEVFPGGWYLPIATVTAKNGLTRVMSTGTSITQAAPDAPRYLQSLVYGRDGGPADFYKVLAQMEPTPRYLWKQPDNFYTDDGKWAPASAVRIRTESALGTLIDERSRVDFIPAAGPSNFNKAFVDSSTITGSPGSEIMTQDLTMNVQMAKVSTSWSGIALRDTPVFGFSFNGKSSSYEHRISNVNDPSSSGFSNAAPNTANNNRFNRAPFDEVRYATGISQPHWRCTWDNLNSTSIDPGQCVNTSPVLP